MLASTRLLTVLNVVVTGSLGFADIAAAQRLPRDVMPTHYALRFTPDLASGTFTGTARIDVNIASPTPRILLNALDLKLTDVRLIQRDATSTARAEVNAERQQVELVLAEPASIGQATIEIAFSGDLNQQLAGLYLGTTAKRRYVASQLEATDARRMFPCFDEPAFKATFDISTVVDRGDVAISNGRQIADVAGPGADKHTVTFATTPLMSTYLVALLIGDFQCATGTAEGVPLRVCATGADEAMMSFALDVTKGVLAFYNQYYGIKYPFEKLDQIAVPDFSGGAMENTGAIVYRESALLVDLATAPIEQKRGVATVIAHEIAHQWFGDLVTMKWWDDVWLNEGFATWMSGKAIEAWKPEWSAAAEEVQGTAFALWADSVGSTRPIHMAADTPTEIMQLFDGIAYAKTAAVLRMIENYLGPETFRAGVNRYLAKHRNGNAEASDFAAALATVAGKPVDRILMDFVRQPGLPLLTVNTVCESDKTTVTVTQRRFFSDPDQLKTPTSELWSVPMCVRAGDGNGACHLITRRQETITVPGCQEPVFGNANAYGYYRTEYAPKMALSIAKASSLHRDERALFFADQWALVSGDRIDVGSFLDLVDAQKPRVERLTLEEIFYSLRGLRQDVASTDDQPAFEHWARTLVQPILAELGLITRQNDSDEQTKYRSAALRFASEVAREPAVVSYLVKLATAYTAGSKDVDLASVDAAFTAVSRSADPAMYDRFVELSKNPTNPLDRDRYVYSLAAFENEALVKRTLDYAMSPEARAQDVPGLVFTAFGNPAGRRVAWEFVKANYDAVVTKSGPTFGPGLVNVVGFACDRDLISDMAAFFDQKKVPGTERTLQQGLERARNCAGLKERQQAVLHQWLANRAESSGTTR